MAPWLGRPHRTLFQSAKADAVAYPSFLPERGRPVKPDCAIAMSRLRKLVIRLPYRKDSPSSAPCGRERLHPERQRDGTRLWIFVGFSISTPAWTATPRQKALQIAPGS